MFFCFHPTGIQKGVKMKAAKRHKSDNHYGGQNAIPPSGPSHGFHWHNGHFSLLPWISLDQIRHFQCRP
jgi:hypothetical protein